MAALVTAMALCVLLWPRGAATTPMAPGGLLVDPSGQPAPLTENLAPVTLLHFWATWCPPCIEEAPALERLDRAFSGYGGFKVLRVAVADSPARVDSLYGGRAPRMLYDPRWDVAHRFGTEQLPETYLLVNGRIVEKFIGENDWDDPMVRRKITLRLADAGAAAATPAAEGRGSRTQP